MINKQHEINEITTITFVGLNKQEYKMVINK